MDIMKSFLYEKIREYAYLDSREIWLFPIELSNSEKEITYY